MPDVRPNGERAPDGISRQTARLGLLAAALPTMATQAYEWIADDTPDNGIRAMAGVLVGAVVAWQAAQPTHSRAGSPEPAGG